MSDDYIKREEYQKMLDRIHERVDDISESATRMETTSTHIKESVDKICSCLYGNGKDGLITKVGHLLRSANFHYKVTIVLIVAILGMAFHVIQTYFIGS